MVSRLGPLMPVATVEVVPPLGFTPTGRVRRFQDRTVSRLRSKAQDLARDAIKDLRREVAVTYTEGDGDTLKSLTYNTTATRDGVTIRYMAGGRALPFLTALAGEPLASPGHVIRAKPGRLLKFYWKNPTNGGGPGVYAMQEVNWRTRQGRDVLSEVLSDHAQRFTRTMVQEHDAALVQFIQTELQVPSRSPRVSVRLPQ